MYLGNEVLLLYTPPTTPPFSFFMPAPREGVGSSRIPSTYGAAWGTTTTTRGGTEETPRTTRSTATKATPTPTLRRHAGGAIAVSGDDNANQLIAADDRTEATREVKAQLVYDFVAYAFMLRPTPQSRAIITNTLHECMFALMHTYLLFVIRGLFRVDTFTPQDMVVHAMMGLFIGFNRYFCGILCHKAVGDVAVSLNFLVHDGQWHQMREGPDMFLKRMGLDFGWFVLRVCVGAAAIALSKVTLENAGQNAPAPQNTLDSSFFVSLLLETMVISIPLALVVWDYIHQLSAAQIAKRVDNFRTSGMTQILMANENLPKPHVSRLNADLGIHSQRVGHHGMVRAWAYSPQGAMRLTAHVSAAYGFGAFILKPFSGSFGSIDLTLAFMLANQDASGSPYLTFVSFGLACILVAVVSLMYARSNLVDRLTSKMAIRMVRENPSLMSSGPHGVRTLLDWLYNPDYLYKGRPKPLGSPPSRSPTGSLVGEEGAEELTSPEASLVSGGSISKPLHGY